MADEQQEHERADRDQERSEEAHWQVVEAGAAEEQQDDRHTKAAGSGEEPKRATDRG